MDTIGISTEIQTTISGALLIFGTYNFAVE